jgi:hypothetical protein
MNTEAFDFIRKHYAPARICLVGLSDPLYQLVRMGQALITPDQTRSKWNHSFLLGEQRGWFWWKRTYILESDFHFSFRETQFINGPRESLLQKWCKDSIEYACVLGMPLTSHEEQRVLAKASEIARDKRYRYTVEGLFGTLWAMRTGRLHKRNIFDMKYAVQCSTFVRMCYQAINKDPLAGSTDDISNTSPERLWQSPLFTVRHEWHRQVP